MEGIQSVIYIWIHKNTRLLKISVLQRITDICGFLKIMTNFEIIIIRVQPFTHIQFILVRQVKFYSVLSIYIYKNNSHKLNDITAN